MKKLMVRFTMTTAISFGLLACGKGFEAKNFGALPISPAVQVKTRAVGDPTDPKTANAYSLDSGEVTKKPIVYTDSVNEVKSAYSEVKGSLQVSNFKFQFDEKTRDLSLRGDLNIGATTEGKPLAFVMHGKMLPQQSTFMAVTDEKSPLVKLLAAKVTCVSDDCKDFLVDFAYKVEQEKAIYVVRVNNITPKEETIENFPVKETPQVEAPKTSPKSEPAQGAESKKTSAKAATAAPAPKTLKTPRMLVPKSKISPEVLKAQSKAIVVTQPALKSTKTKLGTSSVAVWFKELVSPAAAPEKNKPVVTGRIRKANEPKHHSHGIKPILKAEPVVKAQPIVKTESPVVPNGPSVMVEEETGTADIALEDSDTTESVTELADSDLKAIDIVAMFPELKEEKDNADKSLADRRDKEGIPLPPAMGPSDFLKALGTEENLSPVAQQVLMTLPPGVNQAVQVMGKNKVIQRRLQNGVNLIPLVSQLEAQSGLRILHPEQNNFWGTTELVATVVRIGQWVLKNVGNIQLDVADLSDHNGGLQVRPGTHIRTHRSHQYGVDVDLGYLIAKNNEAGKMRIPSLKSEDFLMDKQWELFQVLFREDIAQQIYVSGPVKRGLCLYLKQFDQLNKESNAEYASRIAVVAGHENHFHLRIKCGPDQKLCGPTPKVLPHPCPR